MSRKMISQVVMVAGLVLVVLSLAADVLGIGSYPGIHGAQIAGAVVGLLAAILGFWFSRSRADNKPS